MEDDPLLRKFQKELSAGTVSLVLLAIVAAIAIPATEAPGSQQAAMTACLNSSR